MRNFPPGRRPVAGGAGAKEAPPPASTRATLAQLFDLMARAGIRPIHFLVPAVLSLGVMVMEAASLGLLVPLLHGVIEMDFSFAARLPLIPALIDRCAATTGASPNACGFFVLVGAAFLASMGKLLLECAAAARTARQARNLSHRLRVLVFERYMTFGNTFFDRANVGHLTTVLTVFTARVAGELQRLAATVTDFLLLLVYLALMWWISWPLTLLALLIVPLTMFAGNRLVRRIARASGESTNAHALMGRRVFNVLSCIELVKAYSRERQELREFRATSEILEQQEFQGDLRRRLVSPGQQMLVLWVVLVVVIVMGTLVMRGHSGTVAGFLVYFYLLRRVAGQFGVVNRLRASAAGMSGSLAEVTEVLDDTDKHIVVEGCRPFTGLDTSIRFEHVGFEYVPGVPILHDVSFTIPRGRMTALVGSTGAGKTTLIRLLLRFYDAPAGSITFDGVDVREFQVASLRARMAVVSQSTLILTATIRDNLTYGLDHVSEEELADAIRRARLDDVIARLPQRLDTPVGDRGVTLSGGERQRVAIARAILKRAEILIWDEATSALDSITEQAILDAVADLVRDKTSIVIAHRLSTIRDADRIVVIEGGQVVEQGSAVELVREGGRFAEYWRAQSAVDLAADAHT